MPLLLPLLFFGLVLFLLLFPFLFGLLSLPPPVPRRRAGLGRAPLPPFPLLPPGFFRPELGERRVRVGLVRGGRGDVQDQRGGGGGGDSHIAALEGQMAKVAALLAGGTGVGAEGGHQAARGSSKD